MVLAATHDDRAAVDGPVMVRAASTAFTILLLGGLAAPLAATLVPTLGTFWLPFVAVTAFAIAGSKIGTATVPALHGAAAAVCGYVLVLPLVTMTSGFDIRQVLLTAATAVGVGALAGLLRSRLAGGSR